MPLPFASLERLSLPSGDLLLVQRTAEVVPCSNSSIPLSGSAQDALGKALLAAGVDAGTLVPCLDMVARLHGEPFRNDTV